MSGPPPTRLPNWPPGAALLAGLLIGAMLGALLGATPVGAAAGVALGALADWLRHRPAGDDENK
jgi:hypothetical protein